MRIWLWLSFLAVLPAYPQQAVSYRDPGGRFVVQIPPGWTAQSLNSDAVAFSGGAAYATLMVLAGDNSQSAIDGIARQTGSQWRGLAEARRGEVTMAGRNGSYVTYGGINPRGVDSFLQLMAVADRGSVYLLMTSAPKSDYARLRTGFDQIQRSLTIQAAVAAAPPSAVPPAPAQAPVAAGKAAAAPPTAAGGKPNYYRMKKASV